MLAPVKILAATLAVSIVSVSGFVSAASAAELASHRAAYGISLAAVRDNAALSAVSGQVAYGVEKVCGGWLQAQSGTMNMHLATGEVAPQTVHFSSWEADDATRYRFAVKTDDGGGDAILGTAHIDPGKAGSARFSRPEPAEFALPKGTLFPVSHTAFLLERAAAGDKQAESFIFEGADVEGAKLLVAFISPLSDDAKAIVAGLGADIVKRAGWNFRLAYFDPQDQTGEPLYEVEADLLDNGVAPRWVLDYGVYAVEMKLTKIEALAKPDC